MRRLLRFACLLWLIGVVWALGVSDAAVASTAAGNAGWVEVGPGSASRGAGVSQTPGFAQNPVLVSGADGTAVIAWEDNSNGNWEIYVKRWNGSAWAEMGPGSASGGGVSDTATKSTAPTLAVAADGRPVIAWEESERDNYPGEIYVKGWNGSAWVEMGAGSASGGGISNSEDIGSYVPSLAIGPDKLPIIAWSEAQGGKSWIYVKKWNGSNWIELGAGSASGGGISNGPELSSSPSLAIGPDGKPVVAWEDNSSNWEIYVRRWNGSAWVEMGVGSASGGGISNNKTFSDSPSLAIGSDGAPVVAWTDSYNYEGRIYVRRWNGSAWAEMGAGSATTTGIGNNGDHSASPSLAIGPDNVPVIAWESRAQGRVFVRRWNGSAWAEVGVGSASGGGISGSQSYAEHPTVAIGPAGRPAVAWRDSATGSPDIYLRRWNDSDWVEMGAGSASIHAGISNTGKAAYPSLAVGPDGRPVVAWEDNSSGNWEIYVRRWNGSAWVEMGAGSASGGGVSNNLTHSNSPSLAIGPDGTVWVAWQEEYAYFKSWVYVRRWDGSAWVEIGPGSASGVGMGNGFGESYSPTLVIDPDGAPVIAWLDSGDPTNSHRNVYVKRWNGAAWVEMGAGSASGLGISGTAATSGVPALAVGPDRMPVVAWPESIDPYSNQWEIYVKRWNGAAWVEMGAGSASGGGISHTANPSIIPSLIIGPDNKPVIAWQEGLYKDGVGMTSAIYVRRWNGSVWEEMGAGSASGDGISYHPEGIPASYPSLAIGPGGGPVVAWGVHYSLWYSEDDIFVKRWDGSAWVEMDEGSATGRGISDHPGNSAYPSLAAGPNKMPVAAWMDGDDIFVRRYPAACHALTLTHTGQGDNPTASPAHSADCPAGQYHVGESITLFASPATGWIVSGWSGTTNDGSAAIANTVIMPDAGHTAAVSYREFDATNWGIVPAIFK